MTERRFDRYPKIVEMLARMTPEGRELVRVWHLMMVEAFERFAVHTRQEAKKPWGTSAENLAASAGAGLACTTWGNVLNQVSALFATPEHAEWCCAPGMMASPNPCPQHGWSPEGEYPIGTLITRPDAVNGRERAVRVWEAANVSMWVSIDCGCDYLPHDLVGGGWTVVGNV